MLAKNNKNIHDTEKCMIFTVYHDNLAFSKTEGPTPNICYHRSLQASAEQTMNIVITKGVCWVKKIAVQQKCKDIKKKSRPLCKVRI